MTSPAKYQELNRTRFQPKILKLSGLCVTDVNLGNYPVTHEMYVVQVVQ